MTAVDIFIDTNILIYAHDLDAGDKHHRASQLNCCVIFGIGVTFPVSASKFSKKCTSISFARV